MDSAADAVYVFTWGSRSFWSGVWNYVRRCLPAPSQGHHFQPTRTRHGVLRRIDSRDAVVLPKAASSKAPVVVIGCPWRRLPVITRFIVVMLRQSRHSVPADDAWPEPLERSI